MWLLWAAAVVVGFLWSMAVLGMSMELAGSTSMWWVVLPFGIAPLVVVLLLVGRVIRREAADHARPRRSGSTGEVPACPDSQGGEVGLLDESRPTLVEELTERELEVLRLLNTGRTNDEIARDLYVARGTVKAHVSNIMGKLAASNRTEAVARGREFGLLWAGPDGGALQRDHGRAAKQE